MFSRIWTKPYTKSCSEQIERLKAALQDCDAVVIGAGLIGMKAAEGLKNTFPTLRQSTASRICIPAAFIPLPCRRSIGAIGADTSISTAIWMPPNRSTMTF